MTIDVRLSDWLMKKRGFFRFTPLTTDLFEDRWNRPLYFFTKRTLLLRTVCFLDMIGICDMDYCLLIADDSELIIMGYNYSGLLYIVDYHGL